MDKKLVNAINEQINAEYFSSYLYLSMAAFCESKNLPGVSHWMQLHAKEELMHMQKFFDFMNDMRERVILAAIDKPESEFSSVKDLFEKTLAHEKKITKSINDLYTIAQEVHDNAALTFLQWFIAEQIEEEKNASDILGQLGFIKEDSYGILMLDQELAKRAAAPEAPAE